MECMAMLSRRVLLLAIGLTAAAFVAPPAFAVTVPDAKALVQALGDNGTKMLAAPNLSPEQREQAFRQLLRANFDIDGMAALALGRFAKQATEAQARDYRTLFEELIVKVYSAHLGKHSWDSFSVTDARQADDESDVVASETITAGHPPTRVAWRVHDTAQGLKIIDVSVEGISMVVTQRQEFASVIQNGKGGIDALLAQLRTKVTDLR
jgi:phospholipid transport system substrate-binding protein